MDDQDVISQHVSVFGVSRISSSPFNDTLCPLDAVPTMDVYFSVINLYGITIFTIGGLVVLIILGLYIDILRNVMEEPTPRVKTHTAIVVSVYPVIALVTYCAMIVPRAQLLAEAVTQGVFMAAMYQLFCLFVAYCGGEAELIRRVKPDSLNPRVGPCCCWPCCCLLPQCSIDKNKIRYLRLLVLQLPFVQGIVYMVLLIMWAEEESLYQVNYYYVQPVIITSILFGVWGMIMTITMLKEVLKDHQIQIKFIVLQIVLLLAKIQGLITRAISWSGVLPCKPPITPPVYGNLIYNCIMLSELLLLITIARKIYKKRLPDIGLTIINNNTIEQVCVITDRIGSIRRAMEKNPQVPPTPQTDKSRF